VIGLPVSHSLSPALHNAAFQALGVEVISVGYAVEPADLREAVLGLRALGAIGASVTMPHKKAVVALADSATALVQRLGAANCLTFRDGAICASSTDGDGFLDALREQGGFSVEGKRVALLGAGGAAVAIAVALTSAGAEVSVVARRDEAADALVSIAGPRARRATPQATSQADLVVNATPLGMAGTATEAMVPVDPADLRAGQVVFDTIYSPRKTPLLMAAEAKGATPIGGLAMLVHQARHQLEGWLGEPVAASVLWSAIEGM
jgi:shikimate dehydrogenase